MTSHCKLLLPPLLSLGQQGNNEGFLAPTRNLDKPDPRCAPLRYVRKETIDAPHLNIMMNNNFAFGGINTSLIFRRWPG